jgi:PIN domain nuclease of toxin-antitoxin system
VNYVLDACAMVAYTEGEPGGNVVAQLLADTNAVCYAHAVNMCEVYYQSIRRSDSYTAGTVITGLYGDGVMERRDMGIDFWQAVGNLKSRGRISLPDCFCITLAQNLNAEVVTSDHGEFDPLVSLGIVPITFIR